MNSREKTYMVDGTDLSISSDFSDRTCVALLALSLAFTALNVGCASYLKKYVEPHQAATSIPESNITDYPCNVILNVETLKNGEPVKERARLGGEVLVASAVASSGFKIERGEANEQTGRLDVTCNIESDEADQRLSLLLTFYSFGLLGSTVTETLDLKMIYTPPVGEPITKHYRENVYVVVGFLASREDLQKTSESGEALAKRVIEEKLVDFEYDPQVQVAMAEQRRFRTSPTDHPGTSAPQIATLSATSAVQPAGLVTPLPDVTAPLFTQPPVVR